MNEYQRNVINQVDIPHLQDYLGFRFKNNGALYGVSHFNASQKRIYGKIRQKQDQRQTKIAWKIDVNKEAKIRRRRKTKSSSTSNTQASQSTSQQVEYIPNDPMKIEETVPMNRTSEPLGMACEHFDDC